MAFSNRLVSPASPHTDSTGRPPRPEPRNDLWGESFRDAALGMCAVLSATDGRIDPAARMRVAQMVGAHEVLGRQSADDLRNLFEDNCARLIMDPAFGHAYVMAQIAKATEQPEHARAVVRIGLIVGRIEGELDAHAVTVIREACQVLRLDPHEFGM
ncbi:TerB family tellurite resistance protein [Nocardia sp. CDC153]|uniref:tellurite resistance TerB family protein n=1 Tax=Nocardia sp. CDC153 TaxID=3112167 RepID=UPI002DC01E7A|nr:TerB family tellurite resistance protein [Nocardia sp. CDC153]MEC3958846.1 TerB family tellurite resistance protein [Nocardia sp. CDC153]